MNGRLVVKQSPQGHDRLEEFLSVLGAFGNGAPPGQYLSKGHFRWAAEILGVKHSRRDVLAALKRPKTMRVVDEPLDTALAQVRRTVGVTLSLDRDGLRDAMVPLDRRVTFEVRQQSLARGLDDLLHPLGLDWFVFQDGGVIITSRDRVSAAVEIRAFRTNVALATGLAEHALLDLIAASIDPRSWDTAGGSGRMRALPGVLIVRQNRRVQDQIEQLLTRLEARSD
ncbi:MAG: hypothetical protein ACKV0T_10325 [Planctomycetales bacterium]